MNERSRIAAMEDIPADALAGALAVEDALQTIRWSKGLLPIEEGRVLKNWGPEYNCVCWRLAAQSAET